MSTLVSDASTKLVHYINKHMWHPMTFCLLSVTWRVDTFEGSDGPATCFQCVILEARCGHSR